MPDPSGRKRGTCLLPSEALAVSLTAFVGEMAMNGAELKP
jgi:hypothetical protein